jgi:hypothetical protein
MNSLVEFARGHIRGCDIIATTDSSIALLFPETPRQGAEVTSRRLRDLILQRLSELSEQPVEEIIPIEIASYPDTAGARTLSGFLDDLAAKGQN